MHIRCLTNIEWLEKTSKDHEFGARVKYGKMAIISAVGIFGISDEDIAVFRAEKKERQDRQRTIDMLARKKEKLNLCGVGFYKLCY